MMTTIPIRFQLIAALFLCTLAHSTARAQPVGDPFGGAAIQIQNQSVPGASSRVRPGNVKVAPGNPGAPGAASTPDGQPAAAGQPTPPDGAAAAEAAAPLEAVKRTNEPPEPPNPDELKAKPDGEGLVQFQFRNQPWPEVVRWLASVSDLSLDWQELPGDYINLATQRPFTLEEASDMINRALLARGYTLLKHEGVLLVAKVEALNPALVPRVRAEELANLPPHSYVRTSFPLTWLIADEIHEEFASMISKNGKLTPLGSTNRLEGMDAASNLRDIYEILEMEQSAKALENLAREFVLEHARASSIKVQLEEFLGINRPGGGGGGGGSRDAMQQQMQMQMQQQMQQMQQQMQQAQQQAGGAKPSRRRGPQEVFLVANDRSNSVIVHASPDKMAIVASFIARVDVPNENAADFQRMNTRMKVFRLASLSPLELVNSLNSMDVLEPTTRLQVDETNNAIIAYASIADQYLIQSVVERLDGSERTFEVIQLRRLEAEAVAGSIKFLMGADEEDMSNNRRNSYSYYDYYGGYGGYGGSANKQKSSDKMRVGANVQDNQVLLWANPIEMEEVQNLLVKLGEVAPAGGRRSTTRVIDASRQPETFEYLQRLKEQWERVSPNPLAIPDASEFSRPNEEPRKTTPAEDSKPEPEPEPESGNQPPPNKAVPIGDGKLTYATPAAASVRKLDSTQPLNPTQPLNSQRLVSSPFAQATEPQQLEDNQLATPAPLVDQSQPPAAPPVEISIDSTGNLIIQSNDTDALDRLEEVMMANRPPQKPYDIFKVKYARASWVSLNLEEYFEKKDEESNRFFSFFFDGRPPKDKEESQLGKKPPLRFIYDNDTKSIVVQGASDDDRKTIKELIDLWDVPEPEDEEDKNRYTKLLRIKHSRADAIVNTIKEAYRDLLSATDKSVQPQQDGNEEEKRSGSGGGGIVQSGGGLNYAFKGKLSLGADTITNSILISAEGQALMDIICDMIEQLDNAARPEGNVEVYQLSSGVNGKSLERALRAILQSPSQQPPEAQQAQNGQPAPNGGEAQTAPNNGGQGRRGRGNGRGAPQAQAVFGGE